MFQHWKDLLFLHWVVAADDLEHRLPPGLHLDTYDGDAWLGIVPFAMEGVRPRGVPSVRGLSSFLELNVRTYVFDEAGVPGVWFFSLDASSRIACAIARSQFHLPYYEATMTSSTRSDGWVDYSALRDGEVAPATYRYRGAGPPRTAAPGSLEQFLLERYNLYAYQSRKGQLWRGSVAHDPYRFQRAEVTESSTRPLAWNGLKTPATEPHHACVAAAVDVSVFRLEKLARRAI